MFQRPGTIVEAHDHLLVSADLPALEGWLADGAAGLAAQEAPAPAGRWIEAVIMPESTIVGSSLATLESFAQRGITVAAVATQNPRIEGGFADVRLGIGDILYLHGDPEAVRQTADESEILLLWPRAEQPAAKTSWLAAAVFALGVLLTAFGVAPPELAFGLVVIVLAGTGTLDLRRGLAELNWSILIMLAALIPLGLAVQSTGAAAVVANLLTSALPPDEPLVLLAAVLGLAVAITPFVNNASTAIVLGPIAVSVAQSASLPLEPFLLAVAIGASIDFLTPVGHHNNTVVMGLAGYRFFDFARTGWPIAFASFLAALIAIWLVWL
ncbi:SLC13 family permease [Chelativorans sp.]|uniref:SLC13 family permease n=1 Tax=Chelativorans sp. TaxID=2203393 RepID=UPI0028111C99|nr:SLC13 family permease [Chelativorans sp.]